METTTVAPGVPGFEVGDLLGAGGTSEVWQGVCVADGRRVALKVVRAQPEALEAAARESAVTSRLAAEHVLAVESCVPLDDGRTALVLPLMRGGSLARLVAARGHLSPGEVVTVLAPLAAALGRLHGAGVVHGDVSAGNVLLDLDGRPVLADLGLGRVVGEAPTPVWGTEGHLAPEILLGADPSPASDVYALGALGWLCLAGDVPGAPGLRPALAEVSRAGPGAAPLAALVESAVSPRAHERPGADELACALFAAAAPEPLRLVEGDDDVSAVTYRLRAAAGAADDPPPGPPRRHRVRRVLGVRTPRRRTVLATVCMVAARGTRGGGVGPTPRAAAPEPRPAGAAAVTAPPVSPRPRAVAEAPSAADPRADPAAPRQRAQELLEVLAADRATAWRTADLRHLAGAEAETGPMYARDAAGVAELARAGQRYDGLAYTVEQVVPVEAGARRAVLRARLGTGAYDVRGSGASGGRPAQPGQEVLVDLVRTSDGWRIYDLRAA